MSAPSSDGRLSVDTDPSATSSRTLFSRYSGAYTDNGEGSSSLRYSGEARPNTMILDGSQGVGQRGQPNVDSSYQDELARRKQRVKRSGGFLLPSNFPDGPLDRSGDHPSRVHVHKSKRNSRLGAKEDNMEQKKKGRSDKKKTFLGSSPLSQETQTDGQREPSEASLVESAQAQVHDQELDSDRLRVAKTRKSMHQPASSARAPSPTNAPQRQTIDPTQLVHMALNLSESRRRNISTSQMLASQQRITSGAQKEGSFSNNGVGSSLRHYLNEQRRTSRNISPMGNRSSPSRHMSTSMQRSGSIAFPGSQTMNASAATLARADKARKYIELRIQYLRLLEFLPPLKPDVNAPGNFVVTSNNVPGSPQAQLSRTLSYAGKQHDLGRPYNPLQYIRNRRTRARERRTFDHTPEEFVHVEQVKDWVDSVEQQAQRPDFRRIDAVQLPSYRADHEVASPSDKSARPHKGWVIAPEELLADALWLEQGDNKTMVENRHGRKIFPPKQIEKKDFLDPRASKEYFERRRKSWVDTVVGAATDSATDNESDKGSERGRRLRLLPAIRTDSPRGVKHSRRGSRLRSKDSSSTSDSDVESRKRKIRLGGDVEHNTGPLALLLEQQAKVAQTDSPSVISPDTPDKWGRKSGDMVEKGSRDSGDVPHFGHGFAYVKDHGNFKIPPTSAQKPTLVLDDLEPRSSLEGWDSTAPNTPLHPKRFPHIGTDMSPPPSRAGSETKKSKRSKLNPFHVQEHIGDHNRPESSSTERKRGSRLPSEETQDEKHIGTTILAAPGAVRNLLAHRKNDSVSSLPSPEKLQRRDTHEPHSAVTRFFKGVKHEGTKVGGFIFRRDRADDSDAETISDQNSLDIDSDASQRDKRSKRSTVSRTVTAGTHRSVSGDQGGRNHLELPSFRPIKEIQRRDSDASEFEHHISRQARERKHSRSPRFNRLAPPRMDLGTISGNSSERSLSPTCTRSQDRINKVLARPGAGDMAGLPSTALRNAQGSERQRSGSRPTLEGKRQWSIADDDEHALRRKKNPKAVTHADIAWVRALFLSSGVKAKEIERRANSSRDPPPAFLSRAAATAQVQLYPVSRKEEHVLAARILVKDLEASAKSLHVSLETFRDKAIKSLTDQVSVLHSTVESNLMPRILESGEQAVHITSEVSGQGPLQVKQITDEIDRMLRARRRRMRRLRGFGWMLVEWALVAVMWWLWLVVVLIGSLKKVFGLGWGVARWLLWL